MAKHASCATTRALRKGVSAHDEGAFYGAKVFDVAEFGEYEFLILLHIACAYL